MPSDEMVEKAVNAFVQVMAQAWGEGDALLDAQRAGMRAALAAAEAGEQPVMCDCERSHNGMGLVGRECDCPAREKPVAWRWRCTEGSEPNQRWRLCEVLPNLDAMGHFDAQPLFASPPSEASREERETSSPGPWPTEAEYELWQNDEFAAGASGSPEDAAREIMHYAAVYGQDGPVKIYEVKRYEVSPDALATAICARGET